MASLLFLTIISSAYADVSITSDTYSKVPTQENRLISTMGVHTFPEEQYFFGDTLLVSVYKVGSPASRFLYITKC